jgi:hypothetical protein
MGTAHGGCVGRKPGASAMRGSGSSPHWHRSARHDEGGTCGRRLASCHPFRTCKRPGQHEHHGWGQHAPVSGGHWQPPSHVAPGGQTHLWHPTRWTHASWRQDHAVVTASSPPTALLQGRATHRSPTRSCVPRESLAREAFGARPPQRRCFSWPKQTMEDRSRLP